MTLPAAHDCSRCGRPFRPGTRYRVSHGIDHCSDCLDDHGQANEDEDDQ